MAVADITECTKRFNRLLFTTDSYVVPLSNPPKKRSFNSDQEIEDIILEADELLCADIRNTIGHEFAPTFFTTSDPISHLDPIPANDAPLHRVLWSTAPAANGTLTVEEASAGSPATGLLTVSGSATQATGYLTITNGTVAATRTLTFRESTYATGTYTVVTLPINGNTIVVNGVTFTVTTSPTPTPVQLPIMGTVEQQASVIANRLNQYAFDNPSSAVADATYSSQGALILIAHDTLGSIGNAFTTTATGGNITAAAATLTGGIDTVADDEVIYVNGVQCIFADGTSTESVLYVGTAEATAAENALNLSIALSDATSTSLTVASYTPSENTIAITYNAMGTQGNLFALAESDLGAITVSGDTLTGGVGGVFEGETIAINGVTFTFSNFNVGATYIPFSTTSATSATLMSNFLNASANGSINVATYEPESIVPTGTSVAITYDTAGTTGNSYTLANSSGGGVVRSAATLTGGVIGIIEGETIAINGVSFEFTNLSSGATKIPFTASAQSNAVSMAAILNASVNASIDVATYSLESSTQGESIEIYSVRITYLTNGTAGNAYTLANSSGTGVTRSGATLTGGVDDGGVDEGETINVNGVTFTFTNLTSGVTKIAFSADASETAANMQAILAASANPLITIGTYSVVDNVVTIHGENSFTIANSSADHVTASGSTLADTYTDSEEADKNDIIEAVKAITAGNEATFGAPDQVYGYHDIVGSELYTTSPYVKVVQPTWTRTSACQAPMSYTTAIILAAISLAPKDGLDVNLLNYAEKKTMEFRQMIRGGSTILPAVTEYGLSEVSA